MFKQIHNSVPKSKLALDKPSSLKKRSGVSSNKENLAHKSSAKPLAAKSISMSGEYSVKDLANDGRQKRQSAYTFEGYTGENSSDSLYVELADSIRMDWDEGDSTDSDAACRNAIQNVHDDGRQKRQSAYTFEGYDGEVSSDSLYVELADSIRMDFDHCVRDWDEEYSDSFEFESTSTPPRVASAATTFESKTQEMSLANDTFDLSDYLRDHATNNILDMSLPAADVGNFSIELEKDLVHIDLAKRDEPASERDMISDVDDVDDSLDIEELVKGPQERLMDTSLSSLMNVDIDYSIEFPTGALGRAPHIFVAKYKRDMKRKAALEAKKHAETRMSIPTITVTRPRDGDISFEAKGVEKEFSFADILDQSYKGHLLDGSLHNWNMRFHFDSYMADVEVY